MLESLKGHIIGSPIPETKYSLYIITAKSFYETGCLNGLFKKLNLTVSHFNIFYLSNELFRFNSFILIQASQPQTVKCQAYISCIKYTFDFMIAPHWNRVANQIYFKGRDFLMRGESNTAVKLTIDLVENQPDDEICVELMPIMGRLYPYTLENFRLPESVLIDFRNNPQGSIKVELFKTIRISVLPR